MALEGSLEEEDRVCQLITLHTLVKENRRGSPATSRATAIHGRRAGLPGGRGGVGRGREWGLDRE